MRTKDLVCLMYGDQARRGEFRLYVVPIDSSIRDMRIHHLENRYSFLNGRRSGWRLNRPIGVGCLPPDPRKGDVIGVFDRSKDDHLAEMVSLSQEVSKLS